MGDFVKTHQPCPSCQSSDSFSIDREGNGYCFSKCGFIANGNTVGAGVIPMTQEQLKAVRPLFVGGKHTGLNIKNDYLADRAISKQTCEFFDVKTDQDETGKTCKVVYPYYNKETGEVSAQKIRLPDKIKEDGKRTKCFTWVGDKKNIGMFGSNKFKAGNILTLVEGEADALAFRDMNGDYAVWSVSDGAQSAAAEVRANREAILKFNKIYICFDADEAGQKAAQEVADLLPMGRVKIVNLRHYKDANEYLKAGKNKEFRDCWFAAEEYTPAGIEPAHLGGFESLLDDVDDLQLYPFPFDGLNEVTFGIRKSEMVVVVAGSGTGKSQFVGETAYNLLMTTSSKIGMLMLEESPKKTKLRFMSTFLNKPLHITLLGRLAKKFPFLQSVLHKMFSDESAFSFDDNAKAELKEAWETVIERKTPSGDPQLWLFNHFGSNNTDAIVNKIDAMVSGLGCEFIFLDHISIVVSDQQSGDERKALDELATKLRTLVERRKFSLIMVSHLKRPNGKPHEEGGETSLADIRGTAGIGQLSDIVIGLERDGQHDDEFVRNITRMRVLKNRFCGQTGLAAYGHYEAETGRLLEITKAEVEDYMKTLDKGPKLSQDDNSFTSPFDNSEFANRMLEEIPLIKD